MQEDRRGELVLFARFTTTKYISQLFCTQAWSLLATYHCVLLPDTVLSLSSSSTSTATAARSPPRGGNRSSGVLFRSPNLTLLTQRWQDRCLEIREACRTLLLSELRRVGKEGRRNEIDRCVIYLPNYTQGSAQQPSAAQQQQLQLADADLVAQLDDSDMRVGMLQLICLLYGPV